MGVSPAYEIIMLGRNHSGNPDALGGFAPAADASPHCDDDGLPATKPGSSQCALSPSGGLVAQEGGNILREKMFSTEQIIIIRILYVEIHPAQ